MAFYSAIINIYKCQFPFSFFWNTSIRKISSLSNVLCLHPSPYVQYLEHNKGSNWTVVQECLMIISHPSCFTALDKHRVRMTLCTCVTHLWSTMGRNSLAGVIAVKWVWCVHAALSVYSLVIRCKYLFFSSVMVSYCFSEHKVLDDALVWHHQVFLLFSSGASSKSPIQQTLVELQVYTMC